MKRFAYTRAIATLSLVTPMQTAEKDRVSGYNNLFDSAGPARP
jgi:hypothetical protein